MTKTNNLPSELKEQGLFCVWRRQEVKGRMTKVPYNPKTGGKAQSNNPNTFTGFDAAAAAMSQYDGLGVGIFGGLCAVDIDHCIDAGGSYSDMALDIIAIMDSYTEISPSGTGVRILFYAAGLQYDKAKYYINNQKQGLEIYVAGMTQKYVTVTGNTNMPGKAIVERGGQLQTVLDKYMQRKQKQPALPGVALIPLSDDDRLLAKIHKSKNAESFAALWNGDASSYHSHSEADIALCNMLAFWCKKDFAQMDRMYRQSGLMRDKWDRPQSGSTYGAITLQNAIDSCGAVYEPQSHFGRKSLQTVSSSGQTLADLRPEDNNRYGWHDMGNGYLFADWHKEIARFVPERNKWYVYDGKVWRPDIGGLRVSELCKDLADALAVYALSIEDEKRRQDYMDHVRRWQRRAYRETIIKDAASAYFVEFSEFDKDPMLFNCQNGTLNLETGVFSPHKAGDMLSKIAAVRYDPAAKAERWERFISEVMEGNQDNATFLQKALGYALTGDTRHECFFILYGPTSRNGKGTTMETYMRMMGDYGKAARPETVGQKQTPNGSAPSEDIARLVGSRFVNISEPDKKLVLSAALVKTLTGNDTVNARFLHENSFEYRPQFKLFINTNHLPAVTDVTLFSSGRVKVLPFKRHFSQQERNEGLKAELAKEENMSGLLNWCIQGLWMIKETGFEAPDDVLAAVDDYRRASDKIGRFLDETMEQDTQGEVRTEDAYSRYKWWCEANGHYPENMANFKSSLENYGSLKRKRPNDGADQNPKWMLLGYRSRSDYQYPQIPDFV